MATIGSYLDVVFEVSNRRINTFNNLTRSADARYEKHAVKHQKPLLEFEGPDVESVSIDVKLRVDFGINPLKELEKWKKAWRTGKRSIFLIGNKPLSNNAFVISKITENHKSYDGKGNVLAIDLNIELIEYPVIIKNTKSKPAAKTTTAPATKKQKGTMTITVKSVHIRSGPGVNNKVLGYAFKGNKLKVYGTKNGWYDLGSGKYITANSTYSTFKGVT